MFKKRPTKQTKKSKTENVSILGAKRKKKTIFMMQYVRICLQSNVPCECFNMKLNFNIEIE